MIRNALWTWVNAQTPDGVRTIFARQDGQRPPRPFVTLLVTTRQRPEHEHVGATNDQGETRITANQSVTLQIQAFAQADEEQGLSAGEVAEAILLDLRDSLMKPSVREGLSAEGLAYVRELLAPQDVSEVSGNTWEGRGMMDLEFRTVAEVVDDTGFIETVELTGQVGERELAVTASLSED